MSSGKKNGGFFLTSQATNYNLSHKKIMTKIETFYVILELLKSVIHNWESFGNFVVATRKPFGPIGLSALFAFGFLLKNISVFC